MKKNVFICHASEDKVAVVRPLATCLADRGINFWLDEAEIFWGDSITEKVNEGLKISDYVVVVLSRAFMAKNWPKRELWSVLNIEAKSGKVVIFPLLVGTPSEVDGIIAEFPLLNDKLFLLWNGDANRVANALQSALLKAQGQVPVDPVEMQYCGICQTPFQKGVHACLGCHGRIVYGLTTSEKTRIRQITAAVLLLLFLVSMFHIPSYSEQWFGFKVPLMWGLGLWALPVAALVILVGALYAESYFSKWNSHLIRTFR